MANIERRLAELFTDANLDALRFAAGQQNRVERQIRRIAKDARTRLIDADPRRQAQIEALIRDVAKLIAQGYSNISAEQIKALESFAPLAAANTTAAVNTAVGATLIKAPKKLSANVARLLIEGAPSADWWAAQAYTMQRNFARVVRSGFVEGLTTEQIARAVTGIGPAGVQLDGAGFLEKSLRESRSLVHTSVQTVANAARREVFHENDDIVIGVRQISTLDNRTTLQCQARDQKEWDMQGNPIGHKIPYNGGVPIHWGCRSAETPVLAPLTINGVQLPGFRTSQRASQDGPVDAALTFESWLEGKSQAFQDEALGKGRAQMWRDGKITLSDLLDLRGNPLTLAQLQAKYSK
ncbi:hypothetical protein [Paracandidimonas soli]|uniref:SPP1 gp7 family phage head morphogenesis protein n=1 Tax=Paracandidimonas soli TaxID=1917182 RepID=A0A4R3UM18_9BURK|nr:hypothetical protein [Paracandidimonas soli]TCU91621.1 hypothetical protein EV686_11717 [Paracandidimonas soli]